MSWRLDAFGLGKKTLRTCSEKHFFIIEDNTIRIQVFVKKVAILPREAE